MNNTITVEVVNARNGDFPNLKAEWDRCLTKAPMHQQLYSYDWIATWVRHIANAKQGGPWTGRSRVFVARNQHGDMVGVLPFTQRHEYGINWWSLSGNDLPRRGFVCLDEYREEICDAFADAIAKTQGWCEVTRMGPIYMVTPERPAFVNALKIRTKSIVMVDYAKRVMIRNIPESIEAYDRMIKERSSFKRVATYERKLQREGKAEIRQFRNPTGDELRAMLDDCNRVEGRSWLVGANGHLRFARQDQLNFWYEAGNASLSPRDQLDVWIAYFNDQPIAIRFSVTLGNMRCAIVNQYDDAYSQYGLGWILYLRDLKDCAERGIDCIDMADNTGDYKIRWGGQLEDTIVEVLALPAAIHGRIGAQIASIPAIRRKIQNKMWGNS
jgi:CelD/BcsL family acetyltransferase involved in cellulose biosynthesis